jgi:hypothetical protein
MSQLFSHSQNEGLRSRNEKEKKNARVVHIAPKRRLLSRDNTDGFWYARRKQNEEIKLNCMEWRRCSAS